LQYFTVFATAVGSFAQYWNSTLCYLVIVVCMCLCCIDTVDNGNTSIGFVSYHQVWRNVSSRLSRLDLCLQTSRSWDFFRINVSSQPVSPIVSVSGLKDKRLISTCVFNCLISVSGLNVTCTSLLCLTRLFSTPRFIYNTLHANIKLIHILHL